MTEDWQNGGFGIYVHWPFCLHKCPYCDFNSHVRQSVSHEDWRDALLHELQRYAKVTSGRTVDTVFFGGGTPSLMAPETVRDILSEIRARWNISNTLEVSLEANPTSVEAGKFRAFRDAGVNRISMGIQSLNDDHLRALGRMHTVAEGRAAFDIARGIFDRVSFDLIYARQHQSLSDWRSELSEALSMAVDHFSLYQLTVEEGTRFGDLYDRGKLRGLPEDSTAAEMYFATQEICDAAGLPAYEVSNHARENAESRHNLIYWRYGDYVGIGPGAHGRLTIGGKRYASETYLNPEKWLSSVKENGSGESLREALASDEQADEYLMMSLRLREGTDLERYQRLSGCALPERAIANLTDLGFINVSDDRIKATDAGRPLLNAILRELMI